METNPKRYTSPVLTEYTSIAALTSNIVTISECATQGALLGEFSVEGHTVFVAADLDPATVARLQGLGYHLHECLTD